MLSGDETKVPHLRIAKENCRICALILRTAERNTVNPVTRVKRVDHVLTADPDGRPIVRLCPGQGMFHRLKSI